jgi:hypothetical protein
VLVLPLVLIGLIAAAAARTGKAKTRLERRRFF